MGIHAAAGSKELNAALVAMAAAAAAAVAGVHRGIERKNEPTL